MVFLTFTLYIFIMKKIIFGGMILAGLSACNTGVSDDKNVTRPETVPANTKTAEPLNLSGKQSLDQPVNSTQQVPVTNSKQANPAATQGKVALNPAHGQPGHRCDIAVGAPLNSPPQITTNNQVSAQPNPITVNPVVNTPAQKVSGNQKLNPAHGQPGHDCAIPVGQPLKQ